MVCGRLGRANKLVTAGDDFGSVIVRVVSRSLTVPTDCYMGGRCSCGSVEFTKVRIWFVAADLANRRVDEVLERTILSYTLSLINCSPFYIAVRSAIVAMEISHRAVLVAISGCAIHNIAPAVARECRVCIKVLW